MLCLRRRGVARVLARKAEIEASGDILRHEHGANGRAVRILLADDDVEVRRVAERILSGAGYEVSSSPDGLRALEMLDDPELDFDLLLADLTMPGLGGEDLARRAIRLRQGLAVVLMSGDREGSPRLDLGVNGTTARFVGKPFDPARLLGEIRGALQSIEWTTSIG